MDARKYLEELDLERKRLKFKRETIEQQKAVYVSSGKLDADTGMVQKQRNVHALEDEIHNILERQAAFDLEYEAFLRRYNEALSLVSDIHPVESARVLKLRYFDHYSWEEIGQSLNYSKSQLYRLHRLGLMDLDIRLSS